MVDKYHFASPGAVNSLTCVHVAVLEVLTELLPYGTAVHALFCQVVGAFL